MTRRMSASSICAVLRLISASPISTLPTTMAHLRDRKLPAISLGLWHNFGHDTPHERKLDMCRTAFDLGITHFDLANNYGPPPGSAEENFGQILKSEFTGLVERRII